MSHQKLRRVIPYLTVADVQRSIDFYQEAFGFAVCNKSLNADGKVIHVEMKRDDLSIMFAPEGACSSDQSKSPKSLGIDCSMGIYVYCSDVEEMFQRAMKHGAKVREVPRDRFWKERMCEVEDIDGYQWYFTCPLAHNSR